MRVDRLLILTLAAFITAGEAFAVMHATASLDNPRDTSRHDAYTAPMEQNRTCRESYHVLPTGRDNERAETQHAG
jgi:hypothetical protein